MRPKERPKERQEWIFQILTTSPNMSYSVMFGKYSDAFGFSDKTFDKDWIKANDRLRVYQDEVNKAKLKASIKEEVKSLKKDILEKHQALEILTEIAMGKAKKIEGSVVMPSYNERIGAIKQMCLIQGWEAPKKKELSGADGGAIKVEYSGFNFLPENTEDAETEQEAGGMLPLSS